jgi:FkbH-like protein
MPLDALVEQLRDGRAWESFSGFLAASRLLRKVPAEDAQRRALAVLRVGVIGNATEDYLADAIALGLAPRLATVSYLGPFDQWPQELLDPESGLARFGCDVVVLHLASLGLTAGGARLADVPAGLIGEALTAFAARSSAPVVVVLPEPLPEGTGGDGDADRWYRAAHAAVRAAVSEALPERSALIDPANALAESARPWHALSHWGSAKLPYQALGCVAVGRRIAAAIENIAYPRVKVVAIDCDDTLWGGIAGDVGPDGVGLSPFDGNAGHLRLQRLLKEASKRGLLLVAVSKNEPETVAEVFRQRAGEMILSTDDFAAFKVGWGPKSQALREAATELALGLDSFLFLDDSAFERGEVRAALPEVFVPELPASPEDYAPFVARLGVLERPIVSAEDRQRTELYRHERLRGEARVAAATPDAYLASLEIELVATPIGGTALDRVAQLVAKTNQFNLTTRRYGRDELARLAADPATYAYAFRVQDRFGDAGTIGVAIARPRSPGEVEIETFLMSCRVLGRTIEDAMFAHLLRRLAERGTTRLYAEYRPTPKNRLVADLLPRLGFVADGTSATGSAYRYDIGPGVASGPPFVTIRDGV